MQMVDRSHVCGPDKTGYAGVGMQHTCNLIRDSSPEKLCQVAVRRIQETQPAITNESVGI